MQMRYNFVLLWRMQQTTKIWYQLNKAQYIISLIYIRMRYFFCKEMNDYFIEILMA